jgi:AP-2 complex subunit alpha
MVVKIALLAENFSTDFTWYVNTMIQVILAAGDFVAEALWLRIAQIITNNTDIHEFAAERLLGTVQSKRAHEIIVALAGYVLLVRCWLLSCLMI